MRSRFIWLAARRISSLRSAPSGRVLSLSNIAMPKRRANGEGNIRKRKDGRWEGRYTAGYDPETGKRLIKNVLGKTQAEVKEKLKAAISESQRLDVSKAGTYTVASWMKMWYEVYAEPRIRPNTKAYYTNYIENHIVPGIGSVSLDKLTTIQIQRFYNTLQKSGLSLIHILILVFSKQIIVEFIMMGILLSSEILVERRT